MLPQEVLTSLPPLLPEQDYLRPFVPTVVGNLDADSGRRRKGFRGERENDSGVKANGIPG